MITLYFNRFSRATRVRWMLEELGVPYDVVRIDMGKGEHKSPSYLEIHPLGKLPAVVVDGKPMIESLAIVQYLAAHFPEKGLGPTPDNASDYYSWMVYAQVTLEPEVGNYFYSSNERFGRLDPVVAEKAKNDLRRLVAPVEQLLSGRDYVAGDFTAADVVMGGVLTWAASMGLLEGFPALNAYVGRIASRPAFRTGRAE
jgi:glutathione S-transferase